MTSTLAEQLFYKISTGRRRVLFVGDVLLDRWVHGKTALCQDGCVKLVQERVVDVPGGAANAERSIAYWDTKTTLCGYALNDCPVKTRYVADGQIVFRADVGEDNNRGLNYNWARDMAMEHLRCSEAVLLSDYDKGFLMPEFIELVAKECKRRGVPCVADCKRNLRIYDDCIRKGNHAYWGSYPLPSNSVATFGSERPSVKVKGEPEMVVGSDMPQVKCENHVGAGDCFAAHLTLALAYGFSLKEAAAIAHSAGRVYVQHEHNRPPTPHEVAADMASAISA